MTTPAHGGTPGPRVYPCLPTPRRASLARPGPRRRLRAPAGPADPLALAVLTAAALLLVAVGLFLCYVTVSRKVPVTSDGAGNALQAWSMLHGNWLLRGWWLSDVSFYTTELPEYMLVETVRGLTPDVVHVAAGLTYTLLVLGAAWLAKGRAAGWAAIARMLLAGRHHAGPAGGRGAGADALARSRRLRRAGAGRAAAAGPGTATLVGAGADRDRADRRAGGGQGAGGHGGAATAGDLRRARLLRRGPPPAAAVPLAGTLAHRGQPSPPWGSPAEFSPSSPPTADSRSGRSGPGWCHGRGC